MRLALNNSERVAAEVQEGATVKSLEVLAREPLLVSVLNSFHAFRCWVWKAMGKE